MMSTKLVTSLRMFSGSFEGTTCPLRAIEHRYMATANSGNMSDPDLLVSANAQISPKTVGVNPDIMRISRAALPNELEFRQFLVSTIELTRKCLLIRRQFGSKKLFEFGLVIACNEGKTHL